MTSEAPATSAQASGAGERLAEPLARVLPARAATSLEKLGPRTVGDLLRHYPRRYTEPGRLTDLSEPAPGEHVTVMAQVARVTVRQMRSRGGAMLQATVTDGTSSLSLTFFARRAGILRQHEDRLRPGRTGLFTGTVSLYQGTRQLTHPDYLVLGVDADDEDEALREAGRPRPIYPASSGMPTWRIEQCVRTVLRPLAEGDVPDPLPAEVRERRGLPTLHQAFRDVHEPDAEADWRRARARLRYEEAFVLQVELARRRARDAATPATARAPREDSRAGVLAAFDARLPFALTTAQTQVGREIAEDLSRARPMRRLLQGDVGSGKTVVALRAMLQVVDAGGQAALLAPTEVLAAQHARTLRSLLGPLAEAGYLGGAEIGTRVALLTGSAGVASRREALLDAASGRAGIVVGTHALLGEQVQFADLGLVVVDEQHRFGVEQRDALRSKGKTDPHLLVMTATPIPRTVAMTVFGDLETSVLDELPAGRAGISTHVVPAANEAWMSRVWQRVREEVDRGGRAYVVCPRIDADDVVGEGGDSGGDDVSADDEVPPADDVPPGDEADRVGGRRGGLPEGTVSGQDPARPPLRAVQEVEAELRARPGFEGVRVAAMHGRLTPEEKDAAMARFGAGDVQVLVSTTVVEVGVDVPEATVMVVLDADRFGISQLHQLRGRVGRGSRPGLCLLVSHADPASPAGVRLQRLSETTDGFELATADLELRSEGDVLGAAQSGRASSLRLLRVVKDADLIARAREDASALVASDASLERWPALRAAIAERLEGEREEFIDRA